MTPLLHNYNSVAGNTVFWDTTDSEKNYKKNLKDPQRKQYLLENSYIDCDIEYTFNSHGFRTTEFDNKFDVMCFGCSFTMGTGVRNEHTWPMQLSAMTGLSVVNLGHAGSSNDTAFRFADYYLKHLLPKFAVWVQTEKHRLEIIDESCSRSVNMSVNILASSSDHHHLRDNFVKIWMTTEINQVLNQKKNTGAFINLCRELDIVPVVLVRDDVEGIDLGRDLQHPGKQSYQLLATKIKNIIDNQQA
jgi:hypothetical protein